MHQLYTDPHSYLSGYRDWAWIWSMAPWGGCRSWNSKSLENDYTVS